jgi:YegS/Rv2252/BmrU family lipid kinase
VPKRALLVINHRSRNGNADANTVMSCLREHGIDVLERRPERPHQIAETIRRFHKEVDCVIVGGGDGSMNAAAQVLADTGLPLGVLPMGTANDLARTLKIPVDLDAAAAVICAGLLHKIDLGRVNGHYFFNAASIGLGVHVARNLSTEVKQRWGVFGYAHSLIRAVKSFQPFHAEIVCDGRRRMMPTVQITVGNGRYYGGGMTVAEEASIDDELFFLYSIEPAGWWKLARLGPAWRAGRFEEHHPVLVERGRQIDICTRRSKSVSADGEIVTRTPARFELVPGAIKVFVPAAYLEDKQETVHVAQG